MGRVGLSRREFLRETARAGTAAAGTAFFGTNAMAAGDAVAVQSPGEGVADYTLRIAASAIEIAPKRIVSSITYNGGFPGPLLRFQEGREVTVEVHNDTEAPEQLHWHGQKVSTDVDGAAEEGTPYIPAHGVRRITLSHAQPCRGGPARRAIQRAGRSSVH